MIKKVWAVGIGLVILGLLGLPVYAVMPGRNDPTVITALLDADSAGQWTAPVVLETTADLASEQKTEPEPAEETPPVLDISGIKIIQEIPVGESVLYDQKETIDGLIEEFGEEELKDLRINLIPLELILNSIANLAIMQMGLTGSAKVDPDTGEVILEEEFGRVLEEILGVDPKRDFNMTVEHTDFVQMPGGAEDCFRLTINCRDINLILMSDFGNPEQGYEWGVGGIILSEYSRNCDERGMPYTEEKELVIHQVKDANNPGRYKFVATYTVRTLAPDGTLVGLEQWEFVEGNPNAIRHKVFEPLKCPLPQ